ncbi:class I SAM-dependent DNA methyltransferase [Pseudochelatococcus sp. B33]
MHERIIGLYDDNAAEWDRGRASGLAKRGLLEKAWLDRFLTLLPAGGAVLDIGCGTGDPIARYMIGRGHAVTGVDSSPSMIAIAGRRLPGHEWIVADMRALDLGRRFDGLIAWHSFFHLPHADQRRMIARFAAHAAPGAMLLFTSGPEHGEAIGEWMGEPLYHASLDPEEYRALLAENGFDVVDHRIKDPDCGGATVWLARKRPNPEPCFQNTP